jgi:hypothetical protein
VPASYPLLWRGGAADRAIVKRDGQLVTELALNVRAATKCKGAIGTTVIEVQPGRARVLSDPGPRQYCVQQGWLTRANAPWRSARPTTSACNSRARRRRMRL